MTANPEWTLEEAKAANEKALAENPERSFADPTLPIAQWLGLKSLDECRSRYEGGEKLELMRAIRICANHDLVMPEWLWKGYITAFDTVMGARAKSWDDVFGMPWPKGTHLNAVRKKRELKFSIWNGVRGICERSPETPIDVALFERVGKEFNIGKTLASEYYYEVARVMGRS